MKKLRKSFGAGGKGALSIGLGTAAGQLVVLAISPVLSRLYVPEEFGILTFVVASSAVLATVSTLRFEMAIHEVPDDLEVSRLIATGLLCATGISLLTASSILVMRLLGAFSSIDALWSPWAWSVPVLSFVGATLAVLLQVAVRLNSYKAIGTRSFFQNVLMSLVQLGLGLVGWKAGGLILGQLAGRAGAVLSLFRTTDFPRRICTRRAFAPFSVMRIYWRYPVFLSPAALLNVLGTQLPFILVGSLYGSVALGLLGFTSKVVAAPVALLGQAFAQVYTGQMAKKLREGRAGGRRLFLKVSSLMAVSSGVGMLLLFVAGPVLFAFVFGDEWYRSGVFAQALAISFGMQLLVTPVSRTLILLSAQKLQLYWDASRMSLVGASILIPYALGSAIETTLWSYGVASAVSYIAFWLMSLRQLSTTKSNI